MKSAAAQNGAIDGASAVVVESKELSPLLKEMQGSFALEGIHIPDDRLIEYAAEYEEMNNSGEARARILKALAKRPVHQA